MSHIVVTVFKQSREQKCGISIQSAYSYEPIIISRIAHDGLFASSSLTAGMQILSVQDIPVENLSSTEVIQIIKDAEGPVSIKAKNCVAVAHAVSVTPATLPSSEPMQAIGYIIMKKSSPNPNSSGKSYSFHGQMTQVMVSSINDKLQRLNVVQGANCLQFKINNRGHFYGSINKMAQRVHEEDFDVIILEAMGILGWHLKIHYDCDTPKKLFLFQRM